MMRLCFIGTKPKDVASLSTWIFPNVQRPSLEMPGKSGPLWLILQRMPVRLPSIITIPVIDITLVKYTSTGSINVKCLAYEEPAGLRDSGDIAVEIIVEDTGCGIGTEKMESIFREFEQVEVPQPARAQPQGLGESQSPGVGYSTDFVSGLGLAVVARIVEQLGGQLRVDSKVDVGSRFSFLLPFSTDPSLDISNSPTDSSNASSLTRSRVHSHTNAARTDEIDNLVHALASSHLGGQPPEALHSIRSPSRGAVSPFSDIVEDISPKKSMSVSTVEPGVQTQVLHPLVKVQPTGIHSPNSSSGGKEEHNGPVRLRILIVEVRSIAHKSYLLFIFHQDNDINRTILAKRLSLDGHTVVNTTNGQEGLEMVKSDRDFDCVLMDIQCVTSFGAFSFRMCSSFPSGCPF